MVLWYVCVCVCVCVCEHVSVCPSASPLPKTELVSKGCITSIIIIMNNHHHTLPSPQSPYLSAYPHTKDWLNSGIDSMNISKEVHLWKIKSTSCEGVILQ